MNPLDAVVSKLRTTPGIIDVWPVEASERAEILRVEEMANMGTGLAGLTIVNEGAKLALEHEYVVSANHSSSLRHPSKPILVLMADKELVGQEIWEEEQVAGFKTNPNVIFLGKGFVLFRDKLEVTRGKRLTFVLGPQGFPEIEAISGVCDVVSATISTATDMHIKRKAGWDTANPDRGTILIGFNTSKQG